MNNKYIRRIVVSSLFSLVTLVVSYIVANIPYPVFEQMNLFAWVEYFLESSVFNQKDDYHDVLFVNTAFDKGLADYYNPNADELLGTGDITDRKKLLDFLNRVDTIGGYRCILIDIMFHENFKTEYDSALFAKIGSMDKVIFARSKEYPMADSSLIEKSGLSDYHSTIISTNFSRYQFLQDGGTSLALKIHESLGGKSIVRHMGGLWYTMDNSLCYNTHFLTKFDSFENQAIGNEGKTRWDNLGKDIFQYWDDCVLKNAILDKYVILGDIIEDRHDTYMGKTAGPVVCYKAIKVLESKNNLVNWWLVICSFLFCTFAFYYLIWGTQITVKMQQFLEHKKIQYGTKNQKNLLRFSLFMRFVISFISIGTILSIISAILYAFWGIGLNVFIPTSAFSIVSIYRKFLIKK